MTCQAAKCPVRSRHGPGQGGLGPELSLYLSGTRLFRATCVGCCPLCMGCWRVIQRATAGPLLGHREVKSASKSWSYVCSENLTEGNLSQKQLLGVRSWVFAVFINARHFQGPRLWEAPKRCLESYFSGNWACLVGLCPALATLQPKAA